MIRDFIYCWREYGFAIAWSYRKLITVDYEELDSVLNHSDYSEDIVGIVEALVEETELGW